MENNIIQTIIQKLDDDLAHLKNKKQDILIFSESAAGSCWFALTEIRKIIIKNGFQNQEEEIDFFKHTKPKIYGMYLYYLKLFHIESHRSKASKKYQVKHLNQILKELHQFLDNNMQFCQYYWNNKTYMDHIYFVRDKINYRIHFNNFCALNDYKFSTAQDSTVAAILAYEKLIKYIENEINILKFGVSLNDSLKKDQPFHSDLTWTGTQVSLVELIYALHSAGVINNGNTEIKEVAGVFERMFNVKLDEYYRTFSDIQMRKTSRTKFLDILREALIKRMDEFNT